MNRPNRVGNSQTLKGYVVAPALAFSGWRLTVPGEPDGGQYHGYVGPDSAPGGWPAGTDEIGSSAGAAHLSGGSLTPWDHLWSGIILREGQNLSDYVYRSPAEMRPRANASGGANVVRAFQRRQTAGAGVAPGNYKALGLIGDDSCLVQDPNFHCPNDGSILITGPAPCFEKLCASGHGYTTGLVPSSTGAIDIGNDLRLLSCPQLNVFCGSGQVSVPGPAPCYTRHCVAADSTDLPVDTVAPAPIFYTQEAPQPTPVTTPVVMTAPPLTSTVTPAETPASTVSTTSLSVSGIEAWLQSSSLISGVPNMYIAGAAAVAAFLLFSGDGKKKRR